MIYLEEWINYYFQIGFNRIYLVDTNHKDEEKNLQQFLSSWDNIYYINQRDEQSFDKNQPSFYTNIYRSLPPNYWLLIADIDEFLTLRNGITLQQIAYYGEKEKCIAFKFHYLPYGNNGYLKYSNKSVLKRFQYPTKEPYEPDDIDNFIKTFIKSGFDDITLDVHSSISSNPNYIACDGDLRPLPSSLFNNHIINPPRMKYVYIKHFFSKSQEEYLTKIFRHHDNSTLKRYSLASYRINDRFPNIPFIGHFDKTM